MENVENQALSNMMWLWSLTLLQEGNVGRWPWLTSPSLRGTWRQIIYLALKREDRQEIDADLVLFICHVLFICSVLSFEILRMPMS